MKQRYSDTQRNTLSTGRNTPSRLGVLVALVVLLFVGLVASRTSLLSGALTTALLPQEEHGAEEQVAADTAQASPAPAPVETREQRFAARAGITHEALDLRRGIVDVKKIDPLPPQMLASVDTETLWLARCIYSETNRPEEMELVAWSIRNRVETGYRGKHSYKAVVLDPWQFSAFNHNSGKRDYFVKLTPSSKAPKWQEALTIARIVKAAPVSLRPFSQQVRHYYSERSMVGRKHPVWAAGQQPVMPNRPFELEARRFRFFEGIS